MSCPGSVVKRLRHRPFTAVTRVQFPSESFWYHNYKVFTCADVAQFVTIKERSELIVGRVADYKSTTQDNLRRCGSIRDN